MPEEKKRKKSRHTLFWIIFLEVLVVLAGLAYLIWQAEEASRNKQEENTVTIKYEETEKQTEISSYVPQPDIDVQLLTVNKYSRPGDKIEGVEYIVLHYLGNPKTTAQENHDYFESLSYLKNTYMSANYVIGLDGEIIQCVPDDEIAYASNDYNAWSISVENCHPDKTGKFKKATYASMVKLIAYLSDKYDVDRDHIIRHYDVTGKLCPLYFVQHEDAWEAFRDEVMEYRETCMEEYLASIPQTEKVIDELTAFLESNAQEE